MNGNRINSVKQALSSCVVLSTLLPETQDRELSQLVAKIDKLFQDFRGRDLGSRSAPVLGYYKKATEICQNHRAPAHLKFRTLKSVARDLGRVLKQHNLDHLQDQINPDLVKELANI